MRALGPSVRQCRPEETWGGPGPGPDWSPLSPLQHAGVQSKRVPCCHCLAAPRASGPTFAGGRVRRLRLLSAQLGAGAKHRVATSALAGGRPGARPRGGRRRAWGRGHWRPPHLAPAQLPRRLLSVSARGSPGSGPDPGRGQPPTLPPRGGDLRGRRARRCPLRARHSGRRPSAPSASLSCGASLARAQAGPALLPGRGRQVPASRPGPAVPSGAAPGRVSELHWPRSTANVHSSRPLLRRLPLGLERVFQRTAAMGHPLLSARPARVTARGL